MPRAIKVTCKTVGIYIVDALAASLTHEIHLIHSPQNNLS